MRLGPTRKPTGADGCFAPVCAKHPRGSHLLGGVLHLLAGLLDVAFHLVAASFLGEAAVAGRLSCRFLHRAARTICLVAHGSTSSGVVSAVRRERLPKKRDENVKSPQSVSEGARDGHPDEGSPISIPQPTTMRRTAAHVDSSLRPRIGR